MLTNDEHILICAVRYVLGRMSYMVSIVCEYVASKHRELSPECLNIIIRDIEEEIEMYHNICRTCGMECDERTWLRLLETLKKKEGLK
jgi:hypothetical protein